MKLLKKIDYCLDQSEDVLVGGIMLITSVLILVNVVLRYIFHSGIQWSYEMVRYLIILLTFVGGSICVRTGTHISIDLFISLLKPKGKKCILCFDYFIGLVFSLFIAYLGLKIVIRNVVNTQLSPALQIPMYIPYLSIVVGFGLSALRYVQILTKTIKTNIDKMEA
ncbi:MAG TPA: TRAP transporter small permease [Atribacterota bacterium]|nr:TRAP transporter small permease [Atribacterota bacterium]